MADPAVSAERSAGFPTRRILGISFFAGGVDVALAHALNGGLVVAPSGPGLANDLTRDPTYARALEEADLVLPDSGLMILWWNRFGGGKLSRLSGLVFLQELLRREASGALQDSFWIMPDSRQDVANRRWLADESDIQMDDSEIYLAPVYPKQGPLEDEPLLARLRERCPKVIVLNLGGGVQERLGLYLRESLDFNPTSICTGAALAFLSGQQVRIPKWADHLFLGWFLRCLASPTHFIPRYWAARKLVGLLRRHGSRSPLAGDRVGEPA